jgi:methanethiol oxidase
VIDLQEGSSTYGQVTARLDMPDVGDELHHFGWNACSSALCPWAPHPHVERRYLLVPGLRSSNIHIVDIKASGPKIVKTIGAEEIATKTGYSRPHTIHCGPDGIYVSALGNPEGDGPGGIFLLDHEDFSVKGPWENDRGPQELSYDFWWHLNFGTVITSEWGTPNMVEDGLIGELLLGNKYGHRLHVFNLKTRKHVQEIDLGAEHQMVLELRPAHDPSKTYGFVGVVASTADLTASIWLWERGADGTVTATKVITIPPEPAEADQLPPILQPFGAVPPLITDIALSVDDQDLYVSCWGTGELKRFDVSDPRSPRETGSVRLGGIVERTAHPASGPLNGGPQMVEVSRDGRRVFLTNSLYAAWDAQFYPEGIDGWLVKLDAGEDGSLTTDPDLFVEFSGERPHQVRLGGGDASSDSYCFPND